MREVCFVVWVCATSVCLYVCVCAVCLLFYFNFYSCFEVLNINYVRNLILNCPPYNELLYENIGKFVTHCEKV